MEAVRVCPVVCDSFGSDFLPRGCSLSLLAGSPVKRGGDEGEDEVKCERERECESKCDVGLDWAAAAACRERQWCNCLGIPGEKHVINASPVQNVDCLIYLLSTIPTVDRTIDTIPSSQPPPPPYNEAIHDLPPEYPAFSPPLLAKGKDPIHDPSAPGKSAATKTQTEPPSRQILSFIEPTLDVSIDLNTPSGLREHKKKKGAKKPTPASQPANNDDNQDQGADEGAGDAGNGENEGDGSNDGADGGGGNDGGGGGNDDWSGWNTTGKKKQTRKQKEEEEQKAKEEEEEQKRKATEEAAAAAAASKPSGNFDLSWADEAEGNNDNDPWGGFAAVSSKKKNKKGKDAGPAPAATTDNNNAFQDISLNDNPPQLDLNFGSSDPKKQQDSGFSFSNWGKNMAKGLGSFVNSSLDDGGKSGTADDNSNSNNPWSMDANNATTDNTTANATTEEKTAEDNDIWGGFATTSKNKQKKKKNGLTAAEEPAKDPDSQPKQERQQPVTAPPEPEASTDNPWAPGLSKKEQRKAKKAGKKIEPEPESAPLVDTGDTEKTKEKKAWASIDLSKDLSKEPEKSTTEAAAEKSSKKKDAFSWSDDLLGDDPAPAAEPSAATKADPTDDNWLGGWLSSGRKNKNGKKGSMAVEETPPPPPEPEPEAHHIPENHNTQDDWAGWGVSKNDKKKKKDVGKDPAEDTPAAAPAPAPDPEQEHEPEPNQEPAEESGPPALPDDPLYNNWTTLSSKDRKKREKSLKKKGLPIPDRYGELERHEPIAEIETEQPTPTPAAEPNPEPNLDPEPEPEPELEPERTQEGSPEDPAIESTPPEPTKDKPTKSKPAQDDDSWGIWNPFKDNKKKGRKGKVTEESHDSLPPPAPTPPPAFDQQPDPIAEDVNGEAPWDIVPDNTANAKNTKKLKSKSDQSKSKEITEEPKPDPVVEDPPAKETPAKETPATKEAPAKAARGFWASLGAASMGKPKTTTTKSKTEQKPKPSDEKPSKANDTKDAQDDDLLVEVGEDIDKKEEVPPVATAEEPAVSTTPAAKSSGDTTSKSKTTNGKLSVLERVKVLEQEKTVNGKASEKSKKQTAHPPLESVEATPAQEEPAESKKTSKSKTASKGGSSKAEPPADNSPMPAEMEEPSREVLPGSFPDEPDPEPKPEPEPEPVKTSKKIKKTATKKISTTAKEPAPSSKTKAPPESTPEPNKSAEKTKTDSKETGAPIKKSEPPEKAAAEHNKKSTKEASTAAKESPDTGAPDANADSPSTPQPKSAEPGKSTKKERPSTSHRTPVGSSWGFWGPAPPKTLKSQTKQKDEVATNTKSKESEQQGEKASHSDKDTWRDARPSTQDRPISFNDFNLGGAPPSRTKSTRKKEDLAARGTAKSVPKKVSRRRSIDKDEIETPSKPRSGKPVVTDKAAAMLGVNGSKSRRERPHSHKKRSGVRDPYAVDSEDNPEPQPREERSKEPADVRRADVRRKSKRTPRPKSHIDGANTADAGQTRRGPETSPERDDGLAYGEKPQPRVVRSNTVPRRPETGGGLMGLFGSIRRAARPDPPRVPRASRDGYMTETEREEGRSRRRQSKKPDIVEDRGYATDAGPTGPTGPTGDSRHSDEEDEEARRAAHRARRASRHADLEQTRKKESREAEERKRQKAKERAREAHEKRAREEQEREEARQEEKRARRAAREERRAKEEQEAREAAARAEAKEAKRRERERERRRIKEEEMLEVPRREPSKSKRRSSRVVDHDYAPHEPGLERRHRSHRSGEERGRSQRRKAQALNEAAEAPPVAPGKREKIANWVNAQVEDPPEPPPEVTTILDTPAANPPSTESPQTHSLSSDEDARHRIRRQKRMRSKYPGLADEEIDEIRSRRRQTRRSRRDGVKTSSGSGDYERDRSRSRSRSRSKRIFDDDRFGYPPVSSGPRMPNWLKRFTR